MTNDELAAKIDQKFETIDQKFEAIDRRFDAIDRRFNAIDQRFDAVDERFNTLEQKVDDGFSASKIREEELHRLMKLGLEAREVLADEMHQRFDEAARKSDHQITLLNDAVRYLSARAK